MKPPIMVATHETQADVKVTIQKVHEVTQKMREGLASYRHALKRYWAETMKMTTKMWWFVKMGNPKKWSVYYD